MTPPSLRASMLPNDGNPPVSENFGNICRSCTVIPPAPQDESAAVVRKGCGLRVERGRSYEFAVASLV